QIILINAEASPWPAFNVCCEKTTAGAWCQNTLSENCNTNFRVTPTSCSATSFCKPGVCYDSSEGLCMENTPQKVCNDANGTWLDDSVKSVPQCNLGCCLIGTQASFVTLTRCKKMAGTFGLETNFRNDISDEATCLAVAASQDQGACVYEVDYQRTCRFTTRGDCIGLKKGSNMTSGAEFFKDYLCSAEELATNCGPSTKTACIAGKQEVYFVDTCGNQANIYDSSKVNDKSYWNKIVDKSVSCNSNTGNAGSKSCGNCDYFKGSICSSGSASYGNNICKDLNCYNTQNGNDYKNGESWCIYDGKIGQGQDTVGSRHFRHVCIAGEETIEPCSDFRNEVCYQADIKTEGDNFKEAACRVNRWADCLDQKDEDDCTNIDKRDCFWKEGMSFTGAGTLTTETASSTNTFAGGTNTGGFSGGAATTGKAVAPITGNAVAPITGDALFGGGSDSKAKEKSSGIVLGGGVCLPDFAPGLKFWEEGNAQTICALGNGKCVVEFEKGLIGSKKCIKNCECLTQSWKDKMNEVCTALGDCGEKKNFAGKMGGTTIGWKIDGKVAKSVTETSGSTTGASGATTGNVVDETQGTGIIQGWLNKLKGK
ncbi:MAG: hypothetical protein AABW67_00080, partial [Nanoarchaeota archaeon]